jgi:hypothetical protein
MNRFERGIGADILARNCVSALFGTVFLIVLSSCSSTEEKVLTAQIGANQQINDYGAKVLSDLTTGKLPGTPAIVLYVSFKSINEALSKLNSFTFQLPTDPATTIQIGKIQLSRSAASPVVTIEASAKRGALTAAVDITAALTPSMSGGVSQFNLQILSFVPVLKWYWWDFAKVKFVKLLLAAKLDDLTKNMPAIQLPTSDTVTLGGPAYTINGIDIPTGNNSHLYINVTIPSTQWAAKITAARYLSLENGLFVLGDVQ